MEKTPRYVICKMVNGVNVLILNDYGFVTIFDDELDANIERIYLQPDYEELLKVVNTTLQGEYQK